MAKATVWDREVDVLVAGTGAAAFGAAITAADGGASVLMVESTPYWGGTTSWSGGGVWAPNNSLMKRDGDADSREEALVYLEQAVGPVGPASSRERKEAFVDTVPQVVDFLASKGIKWVRGKEYPDYYPELEGGKIGRTLEVKPFNTKKLGSWWETANAKQGGMPLPVMTDDVWLLSRAWVTWSGFWRGARLVLRSLGGAITGQRLRGMGGGLASSLMHIALQQGIEVVLETPLVDLVVEKGVVVGAVVEHQGVQQRIRARKGVVLGAGGFAHNEEWRKKYQGVEGWSAAPKGDQGTAIAIAAKYGAQLAMMDDAWWGATIASPEKGGRHGFVLWERSHPFSFVVDQSGERYLNESESYIDFGHHMLERNKTVPAIPSWLIASAQHTRRYLNSATLGQYKQFAEAGSVVEADTIEELASKIGIDPAKLRATTDRFNGFAKTGKDLDFGRGDSAYDRYYSDPWVKPNPNLGALTKGPFRAYKLHPGDLGTKGGLLTDEHARVLDESGKVIPGLYAAGNTTASAMGDTYPGPGATLGPALTFGYIAARHALGRDA